jgi:glycosyltransferase involved in cell wall biosynthesis
LDIFGLKNLGSINDSVQPDLTLIVNDYWFVRAFLDVLNRSSHRSPVVAYIAVDAKLLDYRILDGLQSLSGLAVYTNFARKALLESYRPGACVPQVVASMRVIPLGNAVDMFQPMLVERGSAALEVDRAKARYALFYGAKVEAEGFWVLNANKNSRRKRLDLSMHGFALFARDKPTNVKLYIHAGRRDTGPDLQRLVQNFGLGDRLVITRDEQNHPEVGADQLNLIYNACDVGLHTSVGEGWGLVAFEHAATGAAQVVPRHSAFAELWPGAAEFVDPVSSVRFADFLEGQLVSASDVATALERLYSDRVYRKRLSHAAYANATRQEYAWTEVALQWDKFFHEILEKSL